MANGGLYSSLKEIIYAMYDSSMNLRVYFVGVLAKKEIDKKRINLLKDIIDLVLNTDLTSEYTKMYLRDKNITTRGVADKVNEIIIQTGEFVEKKSDGITYKCKQDTVTSQIINSRLMYEQRKLDSELGKNAIARIAFMKTSDISEYEIRVKRLLEKYKTGNNIRNSLDLNIESDKYCNTYNGDFIKEYGELLYTYLKMTKSNVEKILNENEEFVGYFNYLLSGVNTDDKKVIADREFLIGLLSGEPTEFGKINIKEVEKTHEVKRKRGRPRKQTEVKVIKSSEIDDKSEIEESKSEIKDNKSEIEESKSEIKDNKSEIEESKSEIKDNKQSLIEQFSLVKKPNIEESSNESADSNIESVEKIDEYIDEDIDEDFYSTPDLAVVPKDKDEPATKVDSHKNESKTGNSTEPISKLSTYRMQF